MRTIGRALAVFDCFTPEHPKLSLQEISRSSRLPKSTAFRVVQALEQRGYLARFEDQQYSLSFKFVQLARLVERTLDVRQVAKPVLEKLARACGESVTLSTVEGLDRVCVSVVNTPSPLMTLTHPGEHYRLGVGATSLALMAYLPESKLVEIVRAMPRKAGQTRPKLLATLKTVRRQGYAVSHGGRVAGLSGVAVPVFDASGAGSYCLSIVLPSARTPMRIPRLIEAALAAAADLSHRFGACGHPTQES